MAEEEDDKYLKKPLKGSFKRVGDQMMEEMDEKTPSEALRDDFGGNREPTPEERENLDRRVAQERERRS